MGRDVEVGQACRDKQTWIKTPAHQRGEGAVRPSPPAATQPHVPKGMEGSQSLGAGGPREGDGCEARSAEDIRGLGQEPPAPAFSKPNLPAA